MLIQVPGGFDVIIDGGPDRSLLSCIGPRLGFFNRDIELVILSHPDGDHVTSLPALYDHYHIETLLWTGVQHFNGPYMALRQRLAEQHAQSVIAVTGQVIELGPQTRLEVLHPFASLDDQAVDDVNNASVVVKLIHGQVSVLLTGDISVSQELLMVDQGLDVSADVLKAAHHGSVTSSAEEFIAAVDPQVAVMQVGRDNAFGHPSPRVLRRYQAAGVPLLRNDLLGDIELVSDGQGYWFNGDM